VLERWESLLALGQRSSISDRQAWVVSKIRQTGTMTTALLIEIIAGAWGLLSGDTLSQYVMPADQKILPDMVLTGYFEDATFALDYVRDGGNPVPTINGTPLLDAGGKVGNCVDLGNTIHDSLEWSAAGTVDGVTTEVTVSFWFKPGYAGAPPAHQFITALTDGVGSTNRFYLIHNALGDLAVTTSDSAAAAVVTISAVFVPVAGTWYHIEASFNSITGAHYFFIDGTLIGSSTVPFTRTNTAKYLQLGKYPGFANTNDFMIDELKIYDTIQHRADFVPTTVRRTIPPQPTDELQLRNNNYIHYYDTAEATPPDFAIAAELAERAKATWELITVGQYEIMQYDDTGSGWDRGRWG